MRDFEAVKHQEPLPVDEYQRLRRQYLRWTLRIDYCLFGEGFAFIVVPSRWTIVENVLVIALLVTAIALLAFQLTVGPRFLIERRRQGFKWTTWSEATKRAGRRNSQ